MPLTKESLVSKLKTKLGEAPTDEGKAVQDDFLNGLADAIIEEIQQNALVNVNAGIPVSTAGTAAAQTGATTAPGTGTVG